MLRICAHLLVVLSFSTPVAAQIFAGEPLPARDGLPVRTGTSQIRGRVIAADSGRPLRRVIVRLTSPELGELRSTSTDVEGRYQFAELPEGRYTLTAQRTGFVTLQYGQTRPDESGRPVKLAENQILDRVDFLLPRGGVITGTVVDEYGEPMPDVIVTPVRDTFVNGERRQMPIGSRMSFGPLVTNDLGEFRIAGLMPGEYLVSANPRSLLNVMPASQATSLDRSGYAPTYYPGSDRPDFAQAISVGVGETVSGVVITLVPTRVASIRGMAIGRDGRPARGGTVMVLREGGQSAMPSGGGRIQSDGSFVIEGLPPGEYTLRGQPAPDFSRGAAVVRPDRIRDVMVATVVVDGEDITGVTLMPLRYTTITGAVTVDPASTQAPAPQSLRVTALPRPMQATFLPMGPPSPVQQDLTFELQTAPGNTTFNVVGAAAFAVKSIRLNGLDITDAGLDVPAGTRLEGLEIEITDRVPVVSGLVTSARGELAVNATVVLLPAEREHWFTPARGVLTSRPDQEGRYRVRVVRPGEYLAVAVESLSNDQLGRPEYLQSLAAVGTRIAIRYGEESTLDLTVQ